MRYAFTLIVFSILLLPGFVLGQSLTAVEKLEKLRLELIDVQAQEERLRARLQQIEEDIKPENIARSLAGVGSTKPEELREFRRRQLENERTKISQQLESVVAKRARIEAEMRSLEVKAYHESAQPTPSSFSQSLVASLSNPSRPLFIGFAGGVFALTGGAIFFIRRL
jgi:hypothetical protein